MRSGTFAETSTALLTDQYELTMVEASLHSGVANHRAVFEVYARSLPNGRRYGVVAGTARVIEAIQNFRFDEEEIEWLSTSHVVTTLPNMEMGRTSDEDVCGEPVETVVGPVIKPSTAQWLRNYRFSGTVRGYLDGDVYFPGSPILSVEGTFAECVILETVILSILNYDSAVATTAARIVGAAKGRKLIEMGSRRINEQAAVFAGRAAYIAGFAATSNLMAGMRYGIPTTGTSAHAFSLAHEDELTAFANQVEALGVGTTLLVDTYDIPQGIANAVEAAGTGLGAIRIDSDLSNAPIPARNQLDALGAYGTKIAVSGDLDEFLVEELLADGSPIDIFGVGTKLVAGGGCPPPGFVYKLVAIADDLNSTKMRSVSKKSSGKATVGGRKNVTRTFDLDGKILAEVVSVGVAEESVCFAHSPQKTLIAGGKVVRDISLAVSEARARCAQSLAMLPEQAFDLNPGEPVIEIEYVMSGTLAVSGMAKEFVHA